MYILKQYMYIHSLLCLNCRSYEICIQFTSTERVSQSYRKPILRLANFNSQTKSECRVKDLVQKNFINAFGKPQCSTHRAVTSPN